MTIIWLAKDLANQVRYSTKFKKLLKDGTVPKNCRFLDPMAGEFISGLVAKCGVCTQFNMIIKHASSKPWPGLPRGWTSPEPNAVSKEAFTSMFPHALKSKACIRLSDLNDLTYNVFLVRFIELARLMANCQSSHCSVASVDWSWVCHGDGLKVPFRFWSKLMLRKLLRQKIKVVFVWYSGSSWLAWRQ